MHTLIDPVPGGSGKAPIEIPVLVRSAELIAIGVKRFVVAPVEGALPSFTAGSHVSVEIGGGLWRSYSLTGAPGRADVYQFAVGLAPDSRGGSRTMHESVHQGDVLKLRGPFNTFPLDEGASHTLMIAGGIGVTPFVSMARRINHLRLPWSLHYSGRSRSHMAFVPQLEREAGFGGGSLILHPDDEADGLFMDMRGIAASYSDSHAYCCGPPPMLAAFNAAFAHFPANRLHVESFKTPDAKSDAESFEVMLASSRRAIVVPPGRSILECLEAAGVPHPYSCREGTCGTCETGVLEGIPDHRDSVLSEAERRSNRSMMLCVSRSRSQRLVLDL